MLSGITMALGYGIGVALARLWRYLELPAPRRSTAWQNCRDRSPTGCSRASAGADVAQDVAWVPVVTMWQVLSDLAAAGSVPNGFGHEYPAPANADGWIAITEPEGWTDAECDRLDELIADLGQDQ